MGIKSGQVAQKTKISKSTPYNKLKSTDIYGIVDNAIIDLINNNDIIEQTSREYIVGYIVKNIVEQTGVKKT